MLDHTYWLCWWPFRAVSWMYAFIWTLSRSNPSLKVISQSSGSQVGKTSQEENIFDTEPLEWCSMDSIENAGLLSPCQPHSAAGISMSQNFSSIFRSHQMHTVNRCGQLLQMSHIVWYVCLSVCMLLTWVCSAKNPLNRWRCCLGVDSLSENIVLDWGQDQTNAARDDKSAMRPFARLLWTLVPPRIVCAEVVGAVLTESFFSSHIMWLLTDLCWWGVYDNMSVWYWLISMLLCIVFANLSIAGVPPLLQ